MRDRLTRFSHATGAQVPYVMAMAVILLVVLIAAALALGDEMGNLISPFWIVIAAGIAHVDFRTIIGYGLAFAAPWFEFGVSILTLFPA